VLLVVLSLVLLTASFGSGGGPLHSLQTGVLEVLSPIEEGASKAVKPFRDHFGWVGDTLHAKGKLEQVTRERDELRQELVEATGAQRQNEELASLINLDDNNGIDSYAPVSANVTVRSPTLWYSGIHIDKGSSDGIRAGQPVIAGGGLVGKVSRVFSGSAAVTLITDHTSNVQAKVNETGDPGILRPDVGNPQDLLLDYVPPRSRVQEGDRIVTSGTLPDPGRRHTLPSLFPEGIPIGEVTRVEPAGTSSSSSIYPEVHVRPYADLRSFDVVQVLTKSVAGDRAQVGG
jgi:rod shape-determining protein MreC